LIFIRELDLVLVGALDFAQRIATG